MAVGADVDGVVFTEVFDLDFVVGGEDDGAIGDGVGADGGEDDGVKGGAEDGAAGGEGVGS